MTKTEQLFKILDKKFPGEFIYKNGYLGHVIEGTFSLAIMSDALWLADKFKLFTYDCGVEGYKGLLTKFNGDWSIELIGLEKEIVSLTYDKLLMETNSFYLGETIQDAILNALIGIHGGGSMRIGPYKPNTKLVLFYKNGASETVTLKKFGFFKLSNNVVNFKVIYGN